MRGGWDSAAARWDIASLASIHRVELHRSKRWGAEAALATRQVWAPLGCRAGIDYLICLHELGHVCSALARKLHRRFDEPEYEAACEGAAWSWGLENGDPNVIALAAPHDFQLAAQCWLSHVHPLTGTVPA